MYKINKFIDKWGGITLVVLVNLVLVMQFEQFGKYHQYSTMEDLHNIKQEFSFVLVTNPIDATIKIKIEISI